MKFEPQCKTQADLHREWARVLDMCESTGVSPLYGWKLEGKLQDYAPDLNTKPAGYEFSIGIVERKHVFRGDTLFLKTGESTPHKVISSTAIIGMPLEYWSWSPPKQEPIIPEGFTKWEGGEWIGHPKDEVEYILRDGFTGERKACNLHFKHKGEEGVLHLASNDIIAYKITKKYQPETVMVELTVQHAKLAAKLGLTTDVAEACRKALESENLL